MLLRLKHEIDTSGMVRERESREDLTICWSSSNMKFMPISQMTTLDQLNEEPSFEKSIDEEVSAESTIHFVHRQVVKKSNDLLSKTLIDLPSHTEEPPRGLIYTKNKFLNRTLSKNIGEIMDSIPDVCTSEPEVLKKFQEKQSTGRNYRFLLVDMSLSLNFLQQIRENIEKLYVIGIYSPDLFSAEEKARTHKVDTMILKSAPKENYKKVIDSIPH